MNTMNKDAVSVFNAIDALNKGEKYTYWTGDLSSDADGIKKDKSAQAARRGAWDAYEAGLCCLVQRRLTSGKDSAFAYIAVRRG